MNVIEKSEVKLFAAATAAAVVVIGVYAALDGFLALMLLVGLALVGRFRSPSRSTKPRSPSTNLARAEGPVTGVVRELSAALLGLVAMVVAGYAALILGVVTGAIPFPYPTGDEVYPFATIYTIGSLVFVGWIGVFTWVRLAPTAVSTSRGRP